MIMHYSDQELLRFFREDIGGIIITVVVIGLLVLAINAFFPGFFTNIFTSMSQKLNANW